MANDKPAFVFVHGAWHNSSTWTEVAAELDSRGYSSVAVDLPGAGPNATNPDCYSQRPADPAAFASEPSPNAGVTQAERTDAVLDAIADAAALGNGEVVLVGHSLGGLTISPAAEAAADRLSAVVYVTAFLLPPGEVAGTVITHDLMADAEVPALFMADPEVVGALRLDTGSEDPAYLAAARSAFYGDLTDAQFVTAIERLTHCDEPAQVAGVPSPITAERFGTVPRHYVRCTGDRAILAAGQDWMIAETDAAIGSRTTVHTMDTSHSPFYSDPVGLADVLAGIAG